MTNKGSFKIAVYFLFFLGLAFSWSCQKKESPQSNRVERRPDRENSRVRNEERRQKNREKREKKDSADEVDVNVDINVDIVEAEIEAKKTESSKEEKTESSKEEKSNIINKSVLILNIDKNNLKLNIDDYELWECKKTDVVVSYFLNKNPDTIDDEGTSKQRKRICELFRIKTVKNNDPDIKILYLAHNQKDWCEKKLNETLILNESGGGFNCKKIEDISFLFTEVSS